MEVKNGKLILGFEEANTLKRMLGLMNSEHFSEMAARDSYPSAEEAESLDKFLEKISTFLEFAYDRMD